MFVSNVETSPVMPAPHSFHGSLFCFLASLSPTLFPTSQTIASVMISGGVYMSGGDRNNYARYVHGNHELEMRSSQ